MQKHKLIACIIGSAVQIMLLLTYVKSQDDIVSAEMFLILEAEVNGLNNKLANLQAELQPLIANIQSVDSATTAVSNEEFAELRMLIRDSNRQDDQVSRLLYMNGLWQQNFRVINNTFEKLRKVVVFPYPTLNNAPQSTLAVRRILPSISQRNVNKIIRTSSPKPQPYSKKVASNKN